MSQNKNYEPEFKKMIVRLYLEKGRTIKGLNEEYKLGDGRIRKWIRAFQEERETNPELKETKNICEENRRLGKELVGIKKKNGFLKKQPHSWKGKWIRTVSFYA